MGSSIPVQPGPWSFLEGAGQALGAYGQVRHDRQMEARAEAQKAVTTLATLAQMGLIDSSVLAGAPFQQAGLPQITPGQIVPDVKAQVARRKSTAIAGMAPGSTEEKMVTGLPTEGQVGADQAAAAKARVTSGALKDLTPDQMRELEGVLPPEAAAALRPLRTEKIKTEMAMQAPQQAEARIQTMIRDHVAKVLPRDPGMQRIADYAAIGGLGYLIAGMQTSSAERMHRGALNTEKLRTIGTLTTQAGANFRNEHQRWQDGLRAELSNAALMSGEDDPDKLEQLKKQTMASYVGLHPEPTFEGTLNAELDAVGISQQEFTQSMRELARASSSGGGSASSSASTKTTNSGIGLAGGAQTLYVRVLQKYQAGELTDEDIKSSTALTPAEKTALLQQKRKP